jgi:hypothetical protein
MPFTNKIMNTRLIHIQTWKLANDKLTVYAKTRNGLITIASPKAPNLVGSPLDSLAVWMAHQGKTTLTLVRSRCDT